MVQIPVHSSFPFEEPTGRKLVYYDIAAVQRLNGTIPFHLLNETKRYGKTREFSLQVSLESVCAFSTPKRKRHQIDTPFNIQQVPHYIHDMYYAY